MSTLIELEKPPEITVQTILTNGQYEFFSVHDSGIEISENCSEETWLELAKQSLAAFEATGVSHCRTVARVADILNYGEAKFGERHAAAIDATRGYLRMNAKTVMNAMWVFSKIPEERRRVDTLSLSHHEVVAKLDPDEQNEFLRTAEAEGMSVAALKEAVKERHPGKPRSSNAPANRDPDAEHIEESVALLNAQSVINWFAQEEESRGSSSKWTDEQKAPWKPLLLALVKICRRTTMKTRGSK